VSGAEALAGLLADPGLRAVFSVLPEARVVGGAVRDALDRRPMSDIDLATPRRPEAVTVALGAAGIRAVPTGINHGTVTAVVDRRPFEITTLRRDEETDGRHARVSFTDDWQEDAARRDFTINAMSVTAAGELFDYFDGRADLAAGRVRFVGDPATRIAEDYLRILRFFRFYARYGKGDPDAATAAAIRAGIPGLALLSAERVWSELKRILAATDLTRALPLMVRLGVLSAVLPGDTNVTFLISQVQRGLTEPVTQLAVLSRGMSESEALALASRLKLSSAERGRLVDAVSTPTPTPTTSGPDLRRMLADSSKQTLSDRTWLVDHPDMGKVREHIHAVEQPVFPLEGRDVLALDVLPGPRVGELLRAVRQWWLDGGCVADAAACRAELARRVRG